MKSGKSWLFKEIFLNSQSANIYSSVGAFDHHIELICNGEFEHRTGCFKSLNVPGFRGVAHGMLKYRDPKIELIATLPRL